ncbi:PAS domain S-box protein [Ammoniphilus sp. YIM 78166]|uniref:sensor histidine kinase n=1 Tax=Ammoniphilus sp. YIM 78166 TaxID=1644106 RepID=UPI001F0EE0D0|nr:PAS domain S-box protein [Ammoniphilus sp. YIM 78166]
MGSYEEIIRGAQRLLLNLPDPIYIMDLNERVFWGNHTFKDWVGHEEENVHHHQILQLGEFRFQDVHREPILNDENVPIAYSVFMPRIPGSRGVEEEIFRIIAENTLDTIVLVDSQTLVRYVSPSMTSLTGYEREEYVGMNAFDIIHPEDRERVRLVHERALETKQHIDIEYRVIHAKGHTLHIEARVKQVIDQEGNIKYVVAVARDVTERKTTELLLENILDNVNAAVWSTDKDFTSYTFCSNSIQKISGLSKEEIMSRPIRLHDHIHPEDNERLLGEVKTGLDCGLPVEVPIRWIHLEEEIRWSRLIVHPWLDHAGNVERLDGMILDITDKMRAERALEESEQRYKSLFEHNLDGVFSIELENLYLVHANRAFEQIAGMELSKLTDRCFLGLIYDEDHPQVYQTLVEVMNSGEPRDLECRLANQRMGERIVSITFVPIYLSQKLKGIHGIVKDITQRKAEEKELIQSGERTKFLQQSLHRLANDLANVMKVSQLETRLQDEVQATLQEMSVTIEEVPKGREAEIMLPHETWIQIGEKQHPVYLRLVLGQPLLKMEEEWLDTAVHYVTILYDNLQLIEDLMNRLEDMVSTKETPRWMLRLLFKLSEKERSSLSSDLHDSVLQDLIIWYRKLESLCSGGPFQQEVEKQLRQIEEGLLDAIHQIRITCNELRPPFLLKMGLVESLKSLIEYTRMFANYEIQFQADPPDVPLHEDQMIGLYRIVQELLNNASKHSGANQVCLSLFSQGDEIHFTYSDDGVGMDRELLKGSFQHMGIAGIEKRVLSLEGQVEFHTAPQQGFRVAIQCPKNMV